MLGQFCDVCEILLYIDLGSQEFFLWLYSFWYEDVDGFWSYVSLLLVWVMLFEGVSGLIQVGGMDDLVEVVGEDMKIEVLQIIYLNILLFGWRKKEVYRKLVVFYVLSFEFNEIVVLFCLFWY